MKHAWLTLSEQVVPDIVEFVAQAARNGEIVHVGTDSLQTGRYTQFVTVVAVLNPPKGGRAAYVREVVPRITSLRERLWSEVWRSTEVAMKLSPQVSSELTVHIDANSQERYASSRWVQELVGLAVGQGFRAVIKPDSWCASHASDHIVRHHGKMPRGVKRTA
jgi:predicted RNase H-related nuclease YkuK (DUF458 family)